MQKLYFTIRQVTHDSACALTNTINYGKLIMSILHFTPESFSSTLNDTQDLFLAISILLDHPSSSDLQISIKSLLDLLGEDLQSLQRLNLLHNQDSGGMGEAPMVSAP